MRTLGLSVDTVVISINEKIKGPELVAWICENGGIIPNQKNKFMKGYRIGVTLIYKGKTIMVFWEPIFKNSSFVRVIFHLSQFRSYSLAREWLAEIFRDNLEIVLSSIIRRLDLCVNLGLNIHALESSIDRSRIKNQKEISSGIKTVYYGSFPDQLVLYEKKLLVKELDYIGIHEGKKLDEAVWAVRAEVRLGGVKVPISNLNELEALLDYDPIHNISFFKIRAESLVRPSKMLKIFMETLKENTFYEAKKILNHSRNFNRIIRPHLEEDTELENKIQGGFKYRARKFLHEGSADVPLSGKN